eukprot:SM000024S07789  [mRNA]  locus=s24:576091:586404:+ [translate_table: standard]
MAPFPRARVVLYGAGHMLNDITAACWFTYLLIFLTDIGLAPRQAAAVLMAGQMADGVATLIIGRLIDSFGHFKLWHASGSLLVGLSFSSVFGGCLPCSIFMSTSALVRTVSYSASAAIFNIGWAATQVSHMSLVNWITANPSSRVALNSCRNAFTMSANLGLYGIAFLAFRLLPGDTAWQFRWIALSAIALGSLFLIAFYTGIEEPRTAHLHASEGQRMCWTAWFKNVLYYQVALIYTLTRLTTNISQAILPFFLIDDLKMAKSTKAVASAILLKAAYSRIPSSGRFMAARESVLIPIPAAVYLCSFLASVTLQELHWTGRRLKMAFCLGSVLWALSAFLFYNVRADGCHMVYLIATSIGVGNALLLVTATSMEGLLVGQQLSGCAFVYGSLSFMDKLTCGFALFAIEACNDGRREDCVNIGEDGCKRSLVRWVLTIVPGGCALVAAVMTLYTNFKEDHVESSLLLKEPLLPEVSNGGLMSSLGEYRPPPQRASRRRLRSQGDGDCGSDEVEQSEESGAHQENVVPLTTVLTALSASSAKLELDLSRYGWRSDKVLPRPAQCELLGKAAGGLTMPATMMALKWKKEMRWLSMVVRMLLVL